MNENCQRLGLVYGPTGAPWHRSHCQNPFVQPLSRSRYRVHFAARDEKNRSHGAWTDLEVQDERLITVEAAANPLLHPVRLVAFGDCDAMPGTLMTHQAGLLRYSPDCTRARPWP